MAGWDLTVICSLLSLLVGIIWATAQLAVAGWKRDSK